MKRFLRTRRRFPILFFKFVFVAVIFGGYKENFAYGQEAPPCSKGFFDCGFGKCIHEHKVCNSHQDCDNQRDELGCDPSINSEGTTITTQLLNQDMLNSTESLLQPEHLVNSSELTTQYKLSLFPTFSKTTAHPIASLSNLPTKDSMTSINSTTSPISTIRVTNSQLTTISPTLSSISGKNDTQDSNISLSMTTSSTIISAIQSKSSTKSSAVKELEKESTSSTKETTVSTAPPTIYVTQLPNKVKKKKKTAPKVAKNKTNETNKKEQTLRPPITDPIKEVVQPLLNCNEAGMDDPHKWTSHNYCPCKEFVTGTTCDRCDKQSFYLSKENRHGCLQCFCMNVSRSCKSSALKREKITVKRFHCQDIPSHRKTAKREKKKKKTKFLCNLPDEFLGDRITSYGGVFKFKTKMQLKSPIKLYLKNSNWTLEHKVKKMPKRKNRFVVKIKFKEDEWSSRLKNSQYRPVTRSELLVVLSDVQSIILEGRIWKRKRRKVILNKLSWEIATNTSSKGTYALEIENCVCPVGYTGTSCHLCSPGYEKRKVQPSNPDDIYFVCRSEKVKQKNTDKALKKLYRAYEIIFMLKTNRETNVLSFNLTEELLKKKKKKPLELHMLRNNSVTILSPYKQTPLKSWN